MKKFKNFYFEKYSFDKKSFKAYFLYSFDKEEFFEEIIDFKNNLELRKNINKDIINNFLFNLHISLGISYYKLFPTSNLIIESGFLNKEQIKFWKKFYINGLGEFLIKNNIIPNNLFNFSSHTNSLLGKKRKQDHEINIDINFEVKSSKSLLMWGGGKDSIVSYSLLKNVEFDIFVVGRLDKIKKNTINITKKNPILISRKLSSNLFSLNEQGYYNGHVPITGIIAFISLFFSYLYNYKYLILSNEKSSSEENIIWNSLKINHQYSKSMEFEKDFGNYINKFISKNIKYFSLLRGMYEYKISEIFSKQKEFFYSFSSCNNNFKINNEVLLNSNWCCKCEKCCFVFLILSNFIGVDELGKIFGNNLLNDSSLENIFIDLIGYGKNKPFECVGTYEESLLSIHNLIIKYKNKNFYILGVLKELIKNNDIFLNYNKIENKLLKIYDEDIIPIKFKKYLI